MVFVCYRYLVYSCRYLTEDDDWGFEREILTVVYDLILDQCQENVYLGGYATSTDHLSYIFPDLSQDFVATLVFNLNGSLNLLSPKTVLFILQKIILM